MAAAGGAPERILPVCCISHLFHEAASRSPDKIAVIHASACSPDGVCSYGPTETVDGANLFQSEGFSSDIGLPFFDGDKCFSFSDILSAVENLSRRLRRTLDATDYPSLRQSSPQQSCRRGEASTPKTIGIYMEPSVEYIVAVLSVLRCGEAFMPLDTSWPKARILSLLKSSMAELVIGVKSTDQNNFHRLDKLQWLINEKIAVLEFSLEGVTEEPSASSTLVWPCENENTRSFCYLMYTSGSTGIPKGVCGTEIGLLNRLLWMQQMYPMQDHDKAVFKTAIGFIDHLQEFLGAMVTTCTVVIPPFSQLIGNMFFLIDILQGYRISRLIAVPSLIKAIIPSLQSLNPFTIKNSLKLLVLSGEDFQLPYCKMLMDLLPNTVILNLYGSTEVAGDCLYFDCTRLSMILKSEVLRSVPIGLPISNCDVLLIGKDAPYQGEIFVGGLCTAKGYFDYPDLKPLSQESSSPEVECHGSKLQISNYFRTGDFARKLPSGDLVFLGRKDRTLKIKGHRVALEEIENEYREHPDVVDAAVLSREFDGELSFLEAHVVARTDVQNYDYLKSSLSSWVRRILPHSMIPSQIFFTRTLPLTSSGKVDYLSLAASTSHQHERINIEKIPHGKLIQVIKKVFADALKVNEISDGDDFFLMGGDSLSAAYVSFQLGVSMKLLYQYHTPLQLHMALLSSCSAGSNAPLGVNLRGTLGNVHSADPKIIDFQIRSNQKLHTGNDVGRDVYDSVKRVKTKSSINVDYSNEKTHIHILSDLCTTHKKCYFSRCNKTIHEGSCEGNHLEGTDWSSLVTRTRKGWLKELWKINMDSCVDASPLVVVKESHLFLFIGSHSKKFVCIDGKSGLVVWEAQLLGRIECSAAILDDFCQVVVGCYMGNIYFLSFSNGSVCWSFKTGGEVKCQPVVDKCRSLIWCGSYDHNLYAIDYKNYCCMFKIPCFGSIFASPAIDEMQEKIYVASTSGHVIALEIKVLPFKVSWKLDMGAPVFSSLSITYPNRNIICCLVDGTVAVISKYGTTIWKARTGGPIFAGPCTSHTLPSQVLVTSRDGCIYSFEMETGDLNWKYEIGIPITSSPYVDENLIIASNVSNSSYRLVCVCDSSGGVHILIVEITGFKDFLEKRRKIS